MVQVSVIIPVYNGERYISDAVQSALEQEDVAVEVIAVDDGSTDRTREVLETFGDRIVVARQQNAGPAKARNTGAAMAKGQWLAFLDADDVWLPDKLARQLAVTRSDVGLIYTDRGNFGDDDRVAARQSDTVRQFDGDVFEPLLLDNFITLSSAVMRTDIFRALGGFDEAIAGTEDWDLWLRYAANGRVGLCQEPLVLRRWHDTSLSTKLRQMCHQRFLVLERAFSSPRGKTIPPGVRRHAWYCCWCTSAWSAATSQPWLAMNWYARAAWFRPFAAAPYKGLLKCVLGRA